MTNKYQHRRTGVGKPCEYCSRIMLRRDSEEAYENPGLATSIEHKIYLKSKGGTKAHGNCVFACSRCNELRGDIAIELWEPFARVVIQQYPNAPDAVLRQVLKKYIYHLAELSIKNNKGIQAATLATLIDIDKQLKQHER